MTPPPVTNWHTSSLLMPWYGWMPSVATSQSTTPNDLTHKQALGVIDLELVVVRTRRQMSGQIYHPSKILVASIELEVVLSTPIIITASIHAMVMASWYLDQFFYNSHSRIHPELNQNLFYSYNPKTPFSASLFNTGTDLQF